MPHMVFLPVPYAQSQGPWIYKYQEKFYFCRDLLKGKKEHPKKIPQSDALLTEDSPCARRMEPLPPQTGDRAMELPFLWAFVLGACLLVPPGSLWDQQTTTPKVPTVQCSECARVCVCACAKRPFSPQKKGTWGAGCVLDGPWGADLFQELEGRFPPWCCFLQILEEIKWEVRNWLVCACVLGGGVFSTPPNPSSSLRLGIYRTPEVPACPPLAGRLTSLFSPVSCPSVWIQILPHFRPALLRVWGTSGSVAFFHV